ncbi:MAG: ribosomal-protein-alanine N-acetyltransferase [Deltaproteobacteria bacterium]|jgi:ribosomal-protein-alanine N-acetyltransferase|nr:MAG: ribosomal-protein-alanine N-acetyltransferase [Deltaproteobacteria bacterium]
MEEPQEETIACGSFSSGDSVRFRPMTTADLDEVMGIERTSFRFPWSTGFFLQELQVACARSILAEIDGRIVGYVLFWLLPGAVDIHNIAVHVNFRRRGIARALLSKVVTEAERQTNLRVILEVRRSNLPAQKLYESMGFATTSIRKGYYSDDGEDALAMSLELAPKA